MAIVPVVVDQAGGARPQRTVEQVELPLGQCGLDAFPFFPREGGVGDQFEADEIEVWVGLSFVGDLGLEPAQVVGGGGDQHPALVGGQTPLDRLPRPHLKFLLAGFIQPCGLVGSGFEALGVGGMAEENGGGLVREMGAED